MSINYLGAGLFWNSVVSIAIILSLATLLGRFIAGAAPERFRAAFKFYLAPVAGLAILTIVAEFIGRMLPMGDTILVPLVTMALVLLSLARERNIRTALSHAIMISLFGVVCGSSMLASLYVYGGFDSHNDTFTYLAHSTWLQNHSFSDLIASDKVTSLNSQIYLYQKMGFRMGGSFLLGLVQTLLNARFSYVVYPAISMAALASCCLAIGFPLSRQLNHISRPVRLMLLALPALSSGGLVIGANEGFLPQTLGLAFGGASLFLVGPLFVWAARINELTRKLMLASVPLALMLAATLFTYSEFSPFVALVVMGTAIYVALRYRQWKGLVCLGGAGAVVAATVLNNELIRAYAAIRLQSGVVVGNAVDWPVIGFLLHAAGLYGGYSQGKFPLYESLASALPAHALGILLMVLSLILLVLCLWTIRGLIFSGTLVSIVLMLVLLASAFFYFRYDVASPFPTGIGQSWSQFKLSEWANPFAVVLIFAGLIRAMRHFANHLRILIKSVFAVGLVTACASGVARVEPVSEYYGGTHDIYGYFMNLRKVVEESCENRADVYMELNDDRQKFKQMASVFLFDRRLLSNWSDDPYISHWLHDSKQLDNIGNDQCVIFLRDDSSVSNPGRSIGPFQVELGPPQGRMNIESVSGGYGRETDGKDWWQWVEREITFKVVSSHMPDSSNRTHVRFEYASTGGQSLTLKLTGRDGKVIELDLKSTSFPPVIFDRVLDFPPSDLVELGIETHDRPLMLGTNDHRLAAFIVRDVKLNAAPN